METRRVTELFGATLKGGMTVTDTREGMEITFGKGSGRTCGSCTLCCKLVPVPTIGKKAGERCRHMRAGKGCRIYDDRPVACMTWSCRWLADPKMAGMPRPDRCHYAIDLQLDSIVLSPFDGGPPRVIPVVQVWLDPAFPDAWDTPELRAYMARMAEEVGAATLIRLNSSSNGFTVFPPPLSDDKRWHVERTCKVVTEEELQRKVRSIAAGPP